MAREPAASPHPPLGWRQLGLGVIAANDAPGYYGDSDVGIVAAEFGIRKK